MLTVSFNGDGRRMIEVLPRNPTMNAEFSAEITLEDEDA
jgi:hypothetical protein